MSGSVSSPPHKIVFPPVAPPAPADAVVVEVAQRRASAFLPIILGVLVIVGALAFLLIEREPAIEVLDLTAVFNCPPGTEPTSSRMHVTASTLNVRAAPSPGSNRSIQTVHRRMPRSTDAAASALWR